MPRPWSPREGRGRAWEPLQEKRQRGQQREVCWQPPLLQPLSAAAAKTPRGAAAGPGPGRASRSRGPGWPAGGAVGRFRCRERGRDREREEVSFFFRRSVGDRGREGGKRKKSKKNAHDVESLFKAPFRFSLSLSLLLVCFPVQVQQQRSIPLTHLDRGLPAGKGAEGELGRREGCVLCCCRRRRCSCHCRHRLLLREIVVFVRVASRHRHVEERRFSSSCRCCS